MEMAVAFLGVFLAIALTSVNFDELDPGKDLRKLRAGCAEGEGEAGTNRRREEVLA